MRLIILSCALGLFVYFFLFFSESNEQVYDSGEEVSIKLINSTPVTQKVTFQHILEDGSNSPIVYHQSLSPDQVGVTMIQVGTYSIKVKNLRTGDVKTLASFSIGKHKYADEEMLYYLDLSLSKNFVVAKIDDAVAGYGQTPKFSLFKVYDGSLPFQLARKLRNETRIFLKDSSKNLKSTTNEFYGISPIVKGLSEQDVEKYLSKQITMLYK